MPSKDLTSMRLPMRWKSTFKHIAARCSQDPRVIALAPRLSVAKFVRFALGTGLSIALFGDLRGLWPGSMRTAEDGPFDWPVTFSMAGLRDDLSEVRRKLNSLSIHTVETTALRTLIVLGVNHGLKDMGRPPSVNQSRGSD